MATTTTNFGWDIPQSTDLVKDGATAIAALGQDIDTAMVDLKGGTTGQVLAKASGTDLDFSWVAQDDSNAIQNAIVDAKGDLIAATAADTPARLAVGTNGQLLTADSTAATGLAWTTLSVASGLTKLAAGTFSAAASVNPGAYFSTTYKRYKLLLSVTASASNQELQLRFRYGGNATSQTSTYYGGYLGRDSQGSALATDFDNQAQASFGRASTTASAGSIYELNFSDIGQGVSDEPIYAGTGFSRGRGCYQFLGGYNSTARSNYDGIEIYAASGTITGSYTLYGLAD
jgi:hypothetical protein